jgi:hypothetical protein
MTSFLAFASIILWLFRFLIFLLDIIRYIDIMPLKKIGRLINMLPHACMFFMIGFLLLSTYHLLLCFPNFRVGGLLCRFWIALLILVFLAFDLLFKFATIFASLICSKCMHLCCLEGTHLNKFISLLGERGNKIIQ